MKTTKYEIGVLLSGGRIIIPENSKFYDTEEELIAAAKRLGYESYVILERYVEEPKKSVYFSPPNFDLGGTFKDSNISKAHTSGAKK